MKRSRLFLAASVSFTMVIALPVVPLAVTQPPSAHASAATEIVADAHTVVLDHFNGTTSGTAVGSLGYEASQAGLDQAGRLGLGTFVKYPMPAWGNYGTVEMWIRPDSLPTKSLGLMTFNWSNTNSPPGAGYVLHLGLNYSGPEMPQYAPYVGFWGWGGSGYAWGDTPVPVGAWTHLAASWSPTSTRIYVNGVLSANLSVAGPPAVDIASTAYLSYWGESSTGPYDGLVDELQISDVQRTDAEILAHATVLDTTPPGVVITTPADEGMYRQGSTVLADYACTDPDSGIATCEGPVESGEAIDTSTPGDYQFRVSATNGDGLTATAVHVYTVYRAGTRTTLAVTPSTTVTYPQSVTLTATVAAADPADGTPTGSVQLFGGGTTYTVALSGGTASKLLSLQAGSYPSVGARYLGAVGYDGSSSLPVAVTVNPATTSVAYTGAFWAYRGEPLALKAQLDCTATTCLGGRSVTFTLNPVGGGTPTVLTATTNASGLAVRTTTTLASGEYEVDVDVADTRNCTAAYDGDLITTVVDRSDAATGGGWYLLPGTGSRRVSFGFNVKAVTPTTYKGNLVLIQREKYRVKAALTAYGRTGTTGVVSGSGTLWTWDPVTLAWVDPVPVTITAKLVDNGTAKKAAPDAFGVMTLSVGGTQLVSPPQALKGGEVQIR